MGGCLASVLEPHHCRESGHGIRHMLSGGREHRHKIITYHWSRKKSKLSSNEWEYLFCQELSDALAWRPPPIAKVGVARSHVHNKWSRCAHW